MAGKYRLSTLGCKVNQYESEQVRELLESFGLRRAAEGEQADWTVVNTCAVTCSAAAKSRQTLRRLCARGATRTIACGCGAAADPASLAGIDGVTHVIGHDTDALARIRELLAERDTERPSGPVQSSPGAPPTVVPVGVCPAYDSPGAPPEARLTPHQDSPAVTTTSISISRKQAFVNSQSISNPPIRRFAGHTRAFLKVQDGCDAHCTYCIIPRLRTRVRSKPLEDVVAEARQLVTGGHREIVLTGVFLGAYGRPTALRRRFAPGPSPLAALVDAVAKVEGLRRLRLSSLEPGDIDDALLAVLRRHENCAPHLHLPLQAGSAEILRRMNRQYTVDEFLRTIERVRAALDSPAISTDIIVGFPAETDEMFAQTLAVARRAGFCKIHAFPFSPRPGTAAARWVTRFVHHQAVKDRMRALRRLERELARTYVSQFVGQTIDVLVEGASATGGSGTDPAEGAGMAHGRTDRYFEVFFEAPRAAPGDMLTVRIDRLATHHARGSHLEPQQQSRDRKGAGE